MSGRTVSRRGALARLGAAGVGAAGLSAPALAQQAGRALSLATAFGPQRDAIHRPLVQFAEDVRTLTAEQLKLAEPTNVQASGPAIKAVMEGTLDFAIAEGAAAIDTSPVFALAGGAPFGLNTRLHSAWLYESGGLGLLNAALAEFGVVAIPIAATGAQMGGWFRDEIKTADELKDKPIAISGLGARVFEKLGAKPTPIDSGEIGDALRSGTIAGAVYGLPYDDEALRLYQAAEFLMYPGWWNGAGQIYLFANKARFEKLSDAERSAIELAAANCNRAVLARYDVQNATALKRAVASGTRLLPMSEAFLDQCFAASNETLAEIGAKDSKFKEVHESMLRVRRDGYLWFQLSENTFDTYLMIQQRKQKL
ncbi:MAG: hypothetical protein AAFY64_02620 [Pseudomonadota bacterium]